MEKYYAMKNKITRVKLKRAHAKIKALTKQEEKRRLDILVEALIHA